MRNIEKYTGFLLWSIRIGGKFGEFWSKPRVCSSIRLLWAQQDAQVFVQFMTWPPEWWIIALTDSLVVLVGWLSTLMTSVYTWLEQGIFVLIDMLCSHGKTFDVVNISCGSSDAAFLVDACVLPRPVCITKPRVHNDAIKLCYLQQPATESSTWYRSW